MKKEEDLEKAVFAKILPVSSETHILLELRGWVPLQNGYFLAKTSLKL